MSQGYKLNPLEKEISRLHGVNAELLAQLALVTEQRDRLLEAANERKIVIHLFLDAIDGDVRATQWFDSRIIERAKAAIAACEKPRTASTEKPNEKGI